MKTQRCTLLFLYILLFVPALQAQVGINTTNPDSSAALHIKHNMKGVLLPVVDHTNRQTMVSNGKDEVVSDGMLVYDDDDDVFYFWDKTNKRWLVLNPWRGTKEEGDPWGDVRLDDSYAGRNVYIGTAAVPAGAKLHIEGSLRVESATVIDGAVTAKNGMGITGNTDVSGTLTANTVVGYGTIPVGGIIMWSGTSVPDGWALCDGTNGTPNLKGRFVVGYDPADADYNNPGRMGGSKTVALTTNQMPPHTHTLRGQWTETDNGNEWEGMILANYPSTGDLWTTTSTGNGQAHENRPPYYTLAYIMRIK